MSLATLVSVNKLTVISNSTSSIIQVGDRFHTYLDNRGITVTRDRSLYVQDEPDFANYNLFRVKPTQLNTLLPAGHIDTSQFGSIIQLANLTPSINVNTIKVISTSNSSNVLIGNSRSLQAINRQKSFIQYYGPTTTIKGC